MRKWLECSITMEITPTACICFSAMLLLLSAKMMLSWILAVLVHECCHCLLIVLTGQRIQGIHIGVTGMQIRTSQMRPIQELLCAAAGPVGSLALILFAKWMPLAAIFGAIHGIFNLLPYYPMDGGRILYLLCQGILPSKYGKRIQSAVEWITVIGLTVFSLFISFQYRLWITLIVGAMPIVAKLKSSCKADREGVQ